MPVTSGPSWRELDDPAADGWDTEVFSQKAQAELDALAGLLARRGDIEAEQLEPLLAATFACASLLPGRLDEVFGDEYLRVVRGAGSSRQADGPLPADRRGPGGLREALRELVAPLAEATDPHVKFKLYRVQLEADAVTTRQLYSHSGRTPGGFVVQHATWVMRWRRIQDSAAPRITRIEIEDFERVTSRAPGTPLFSDCTESVLGGNAAYRSQMLLGLNHWLERLQDTRLFALLGTPGLAVGDVNGDGLDDLYVCQEGGLPNRLFLQRPDGSAEDASGASGADWLESSRSALIVDLDGSGTQDLVVAVTGNLVVASGDGGGRFAIRAVLPTSDDTMSLSAADYDFDGDLDVYVCAYNRNDLLEDSGILSIGAAAEFVYHDAENGAPNILYRNDIAAGGEWRFTDVTEEVGLDVHNRRYSFAAAWEDFDDDGDQDLYVANDFGRNTLYRSDAARPDGSRSSAVRFADIAALAGAEDSASGMSVTWGDVDRDGRMDIYISNMYSAAGGRITYQEAFKPDAPEVRTRLQRFARGNTLLRNAGDGTFSDISIEAGVTMGRWAWSSNFVDLNNDGWEDLVVANGYITTDDTGDL